MNATNPNQEFDQYGAATGVPLAQAFQHQPTLGAWSSGLCDCFSDCSSCCLTFWCPCITFGPVAEIADQGYTSCGTAGVLYFLLSAVTGFTFCYSCFYLTKMRQQFKLEESPCCDCLVHFCCETCALCQEYRELQSVDLTCPLLRWQGNVERQNRGVATGAVPPSMETHMKR